MPKNKSNHLKLVDFLRKESRRVKKEKQTLIIPDDCEKYGFVQGEHDLSTLLHFLADMIE